MKPRPSAFGSRSLLLQIIRQIILSILLIQMVFPVGFASRAYAGSQSSPSGASNPGADSDGDGWTDDEEADEGTDPNQVDSDSDGVNDPEDGWPREAALHPSRIPVSHYAVLEIARDTKSADSGENNYGIDMDSKGEV